MDPTTTTVLLIDFKSDGAATWPVLLSQLAPLREKNWLTYYDGETLHQGPLTIVGTGNTPFNLIQAAATDRYIFFDAPLLSVSNDYNTTNSYYASSALSSAVGKVWFATMSSGQIERVKEQVEAADAKGLKSRYWMTWLAQRCGIGGGVLLPVLRFVGTARIYVCYSWIRIYPREYLLQNSPATRPHRTPASSSSPIPKSRRSTPTYTE